MLKLVGCSRVLKHVVTRRSSLSLSLSLSSSASSASSTFRFINTKSFHDDAHELRKRHAPPGLFDRFLVFRRLRRDSKRNIGYPSNVQRVRPGQIKEDELGFYFTIPLNRVRPEDLKVSVNHGTVFIEGKIDQSAAMDSVEKYICWVDLPDIDLQDKMFRSGDVKAEYNPNGALLKITIPKLREEDLVYNVNVKTWKSKSKQEVDVANRDSQ